MTTFWDSIGYIMVAFMFFGLPVLILGYGIVVAVRRSVYHEHDQAEVDADDRTSTRDEPQISSPASAARTRDTGRAA